MWPVLSICSATVSNVAGIALTPLIFGVMSRVPGDGVSPDGVAQVFCELLAPFIVGHWLRPGIGGWVDSNRRVLSFTDRGSILLVVYGVFSAAVVHGLWHRLPSMVLLLLMLIVVLILAIVLLCIKFASVALGFRKEDSIAATFCGSQKSLVSGVPSALFSAAAMGPILIPIMIYYPMQLVMCAWLARHFAMAANGASAGQGFSRSR
jgi:solute carrier family 10 (sodium/bile acid cotransporter), member 7